MPIYENKSYEKTSLAVSIYVCIIYPAFCALVSEICICPEMLHVFRYTDVLTCVIYNCTRLNSRDDWSSDSSAVKIIDEDG